MSSERASNYLHGIRIDVPNDPPDYNDVIKMSHIPTAPLLDGRPDDRPFISIFGAATWVQFDANGSGVGSFFIRDSDGSLQAKGDTNSHHIVVQNVNGMEMLKIIPRSATVVNGSSVHTFGVVHNHAGLGMIKIAENSLPRSSLQIFRGDGTPITVNSLKIGDYAVFRNKSSTTPLCNIQMPGIEIFNPADFNIKIIFHPHPGITEEEQLLCTAAAIAFKSTMKQKVERTDREDDCCGYFAGIVCVLVFILVLFIFVKFLEKHGCETKRAKGYAGYNNC